MSNFIKALYKKYFITRMWQANNNLFFDIKADKLRKHTMNSDESGISNQLILDKELIVTLTTYGKRIYDVDVVVESIMQNTIKPNRIVLWLATELKGKALPITLRNLQKRGLEIYYTSDIKSYKKLIPTLIKYPNSYYITIDDDVIYDFDLIENLVNAYKESPGYIYANAVAKIRLNSRNKLLPYHKWPMFGGSSVPSSTNFAIGVGGVLYPSGCFCKDVINEEAFMRLAPNGDDIWFYAMARLNGYKVAKAFSRYENSDCILSNYRVQDIALFNKNLYKRENDTQIKAVFDEYDIYRLIKD